MEDRSDAEVGQLFVALVLTAVMSAGSCLLQGYVVHGTFPRGEIPYGYFKTPDGIEKRTQVIEVPLRVTAVCFVAYGLVTSLVLYRMGHRLTLVFLWVAIVVAFLPLLIYSFVLQSQGDASVFI